MGYFSRTQLGRTIRILQKKDCPDSPKENQVKKTLKSIKGK